jgi:predicted 2-oxoglutarate/Fe(II)-dependent dioxygenase YbiX
VAYGSFTYTALVYLSDFNHEFKGGEFVFRAGPERIVIEPRKGRLSMFTSGSENVHNVEKVTSGKRLALTIAFTCDRSKAIHDFLGRAKRYISDHSGEQ